MAATIAIIAMAVTFADHGRVHEDVQHHSVQRQNKERQYNKLSEIDRFVRAGEYFTIDEDTFE